MSLKWLKTRNSGFHVLRHFTSESFAIVRLIAAKILNFHAVLCLYYCTV